MTHVLADLTWRTVPLPPPMVLVPVGSVEQHGPHLPFDTDTTIAVAVAEGMAQELVGEVLVAPALAYGSSGEHQAFPGTSSIGTETLRLVVVELVRSMSTWAGRIFLVNGHGGNVAALAKAVFQLTTEQHDVAWLPCMTEDVDLHAGLTETSLMLHLRPTSVYTERAEVGDMRGLTEIMPTLMAGGVGAVSPNGVLGDPTGATAEMGERVLAEMTADAVQRVRLGKADGRGMLTRSQVGATA